MDNIIIQFMGRVAAILASISTFPFSSHDTHLVIHSSNFFRHSSTMTRYRIIHSSFASYSRWICSTISWESFLISYLVVANIRAISSTTSTTSYSISLLEAEKLRQIACSTIFPMGDCKSRPTPDLDTLDASSTWSIHHCSPRQSTRYVCFLGSSTIKSALTCHFKDNCG